MKKALLSAAVAAIIAAPAAQAGVTIYGQMHLSIDQIDPDGAAKSGTSVFSRDSRIGFKGTEDLGNGMSAIWQVETAVRIDDSSAQNWASRNSFIGLKGGFGTILAGNHDTPYKRAMYSGGIEVIGDSLIKMKNLSGADDVRAKNTVMYISPDMSGFSLAAAGVTKEAVGSDLTDGYSLAAMYKNGGLRMGLGYEDNLGSWEEKVVGTIGYSFGDLGVAAFYAQQKDSTGSKGDQDIMAVSGSYKFGNNKIGAIYTQNDEDGASKKDGWGVGLTHSMSKRTTAYLAYADSENGLNANSGYTGAGSGFSLGMVHKF